MPKAIPRKRGHLSKEHTEKESQEPGKTTTEGALEYAMNIYITEGYRDRTMNDYAYFWEEFVQIVGKCYVNDYTSEDFRHYIKELLRNRGLSATTVNIRLASVRAVFSRLTKEKIITVNPAETIKKLRTDQNRIYTLTDNQLRRLFAVVNKETYAGYRDYCMMLTALKCGLRGIEIRQLEIDDIDFDEEIIMLPGIKNKNRKNRPVPLSRKVKPHLQQLIREVQRFTDSRYLFLTQFGEPVGGKIMIRQMNRYAEKANLKGECRASPHSLRHTFAVNYLKQGGDIRSLQKILGHSDLSTTQIYLDYTDDTVKEQYRKAEKNDTLDL